jgi:hypothetical protein
MSPMPKRRFEVVMIDANMYTEADFLRDQVEFTTDRLQTARAKTLASETIRRYWKEQNTENPQRKGYPIPQIPGGR